ncbi:hypothetical protein NQ314_003229 [Rhamnusium bicolor]|uniref:Uncharacterized protein n=1 Tax=Rhamnusium bicolor TaxID=1586634 RepID=A0AAV8ZPN6_9CUCU|nr:hypothetical protein NQ314_003229 [Rhamnusium bicolor]
MELLLPVLVGIGIAFGQSTAASIDYYASKYDHIDVETLLNNRRMVNYYTACMLSKGPCPPEGLEFKREYETFIFICARIVKYFKK